MSKQNILRAVRSWCLQCCGDSPSEVKGCSAKDCPLYIYRLGKDPEAKKPQPTETQLAVLRAHVFGGPKHSR